GRLRAALVVSKLRQAVAAVLVLLTEASKAERAGCTALLVGADMASSSHVSGPVPPAKRANSSRPYSSWIAARLFSRTIVAMLLGTKFASLASCSLARAKLFWAASTESLSR